MHAFRSSRLLAVALASLALSACGYDCGVVTRTVADGVVRDAAGVPLATAQVELRENVGPSYLALSAGVMGPGNSSGAPLRGHVVRARLETEQGELLAEIPTGTSTLYIDAVVALMGTRLSSAEYARVRRALHTRRTRVVLETDLTGWARVEATLSEVRDLPGEVQRCSPA